ncbi:ROK family transcriptional regulator [Aestuariibacter sp. A3R04]|uniref:ROK family transcriptional regulator n=1 Tax=Aestuariibacter sp. A3R04 TaxID=2841571 RepID=UPI001C081BED|nr:ROK family transcriptional regulator [Aestuariibacter sp. A3R04]
MTSKENNTLLRGAFVLGKGEKLLQDNPRAIVREIFWSHGVTQREISDRTKIPQQTVSRLVNSLFEDGLVRTSCGSGKASSGLEPNPQYAYCYGLSILLDAIAVALMNFKGEVVATAHVSLDDMGISSVLNKAVKLAQDMATEHGINEERVLGIGVGISGFFSSSDGKMNTHHAIEEWAEINIAETVAEAFLLPTWVVNDGTGAAAGEGIAGVGRKYKNFVYFFVSSAFGGGLINNGDMIRGTHGNAGELGDMLPAKLYSHPNLKLLERILLKHGVDVPSMYRLNEVFDPEWPGVDEWIYKVQDSFDLVATASSALLDSQAIIIGGHIPTKLAEKVIPRIDVYAQFRRGAKRPMPEIVCAGVTDCPVAVGAATLPLRDWFL